MDSRNSIYKMKRQRWRHSSNNGGEKIKGSRKNVAINTMRCHK